MALSLVTRIDIEFQESLSTGNRLVRHDVGNPRIDSPELAEADPGGFPSTLAGRHTAQQARGARGRTGHQRRRIAFTVSLC